MSLALPSSAAAAPGLSALLRSLLHPPPSAFSPLSALALSSSSSSSSSWSGATLASSSLASTPSAHALAQPGLLERLRELLPWIDLAVPKKRTSHSKKRMRAACKQLKDKLNINHCKACGSPKLLFSLCPNCHSLISRAAKNLTRVTSLLTSPPPPSRAIASTPSTPPLPPYASPPQLGSPMTPEASAQFAALAQAVRVQEEARASARIAREERKDDRVEARRAAQDAWIGERTEMMRKARTRAQEAKIEKERVERERDEA